MEINTLRKLQAADARSLAFTPLGLGRMTPEAAADFQQQGVAGLRLADDVAEATRCKFEQLRVSFAHGILCYELFTLVEDAAQLALEQALRDRFIAHHSPSVEVRDAKGELRTIPSSSYAEFFARLPRNSEVRMGTSGSWERFDGMLSTLMTWARREGLLRGQRSRTLESSLRRIRNTVAHGTYRLASPVDAARALSDLAEFSNQLWGHPTPGGRLYPAPVDRGIVALGWTRNGDRMEVARAEDLSASEATTDEELTWILVRAVHHDPRLFEFDARHATTSFPSEYLWGPGAREEAAVWLHRYQPAPDCCDYLDQLVFVRVEDDGQVGLPIYGGIAARLTDAWRDGVWHAVQVDYPIDARAHVRALATTSHGHKSVGECPVCPVATLTTGTFDAVFDAVRNMGVDVEPVSVPEVRTPLAKRLAGPPR